MTCRKKPYLSEPCFSPPGNGELWAEEGEMCSAPGTSSHLEGAFQSLLHRAQAEELSRTQASLPVLLAASGASENHLEGSHHRAECFPPNQLASRSRHGV